MHDVIFKRIDLRKGMKSDHPDIKTNGTKYLIKYDGFYYIGSFGRQWYGLNFGGIYGVGAQFNVPGYNCSSWQEVYEVIEKRSRSKKIRYRG